VRRTEDDLDIAADRDDCRRIVKVQDQSLDLLRCGLLGELHGLAVGFHPAIRNVNALAHRDVLSLGLSHSTLPLCDRRGLSH
jgi:hypothetical protein